MNIVSLKKIENKLIKYKDELVMLDRDVAQIYGVSTKEVNQATSNNPDKFPNGYVVELSQVEKDELVKNFDRFNTLKHSTVNPKVFTEKGLYMLATIIKSKVATETTLSIIETFAKVSRSVKRIKK